MSLGCYEENIDYRGHDLHPTQTLRKNSAQGCQELCYNLSGCQYWSFEKNKKLCYVKNQDELSNRETNKNTTSGFKEYPGDNNTGIYFEYQLFGDALGFIAIRNFS